MIEAYLEVLWWWPFIAIVRAGRGTRKFLDGYAYAIVAVEKRWWWPFKKCRAVEFKALVALPPPGCRSCPHYEKFNLEYVRAAKAIFDKRGWKVTWERAPKEPS